MQQLHKHIHHKKWLILTCLFLSSVILLGNQLAIRYFQKKQQQNLEVALRDLTKDTTLLNEPSLVAAIPLADTSAFLASAGTPPVPVNDSSDLSAATPSTPSSVSQTPSITPASAASPVPSTSLVENPNPSGKSPAAPNPTPTSPAQNPIPTPSTVVSPPPTSSPSVGSPASSSSASPTQPSPVPLPVNTPATPTPLAPATQTPVNNPAPAPINSWATTQKTLSDFIAQDPSIEWNISVRNTKTNEQLLTVGQNPAFVAASTTKLLTASAYMQAVEKGTFNLDQQIGPFPADFQLEELINQSDNDSWALLNEAIGSDNLEKYAHTNGVPSFKYAGNTVDPREMASFATSLYQQKLLNASHTQQLLSYMQHTEEERFLPSGIPANDKIYHKVGLLNDLVHDIGIVEDPKQSLTISIYSNGHGTQEYDLRALKFAQIENILLKQPAP